MAVNLHTTYYRFGINELAESTHGWHAALNTNPAQGVIAVDATFLLRFTVQETGATAAGNTDQQFQCRLNGGTWQNITTTSTIVKAVTTTVFANGADLTKRLTGTGTFESSGDGGTHDGLSGGAQNDIAASGNSETECALQIVSGDVVHNDAIEFRLTSPDFTITNDIVPAITVNEPNPVVVTPGVRALALASFAAIVTATANVLVTAGLLTLALATFVPTVTVAPAGVTVTPTTAALTTTRYAPTVTASDHKVVTPPPASLTATTYAPTVMTPRLVVPNPASLVSTAFAPAVQIGTVVTPTPAALTTATFAPTVTVSDHQTVVPTTAALTVSTFAPTITATAHQTVTPGVVSLTTTRFAPTVTATTHTLATPTTANLIVTRYAPTVTVAAGPPVTMSLALVPLDHPDASPIRVRVPSGVMAVKVMA